MTSIVFAATILPMRFRDLPVASVLLLAACSSETSSTPQLPNLSDAAIEHAEDASAPLDAFQDEAEETSPSADQSADSVSQDSRLEDTAGEDSPPADARLPDNLSSELEPIRAAAGLPALGAAVFHGEELVAIGVVGSRKQGDPTPATTQDKWHLGSDTKAMTATLVGLYVDRGRVRFEDEVGTLFDGETVDSGYAKVTVEQLLQHRGGAPGEMPADIWEQMWADGSAPDARAKAVLEVLSRPPAQTPGTYVYSNAGYMIAGTVLERLEGKTWEELATTELFGPLKMDSCGFGAPGTPGQVDQPWGHTVKAEQPVPVEPGPKADNPPSLGPAGTVHCSLADWGKFLSMHLAGARGETTMLANATVQRLHAPPSGGDYAGGWIVTDRPWAGGTALTHTGSNTMWMATTWLAPKKNLAFEVVTNRGDDPTLGVVDSVFGALIPEYAR